MHQVPTIFLKLFNKVFAVHCVIIHNTRFKRNKFKTNASLELGLYCAAGGLKGVIVRRSTNCF